jgi:hypothetical protein
MKNEILKGVMGSSTYLLTAAIAFILRPLSLIILFIIPLLFVVPADSRRYCPTNE